MVGGGAISFGQNFASSFAAKTAWSSTERLVRYILELFINAVITRGGGVSAKASRKNMFVLEISQGS